MPAQRSEAIQWLYIHRLNKVIKWVRLHLMQRSQPGKFIEQRQISEEAGM